MNLTHLSITKAGLLAAIAQIASLVVSFGVMNSLVEGIVVSAATAVVNTAFLVANALHAVAASKAVPVPVPAPVPVPVPVPPIV